MIKFLKRSTPFAIGIALFFIAIELITARIPNSYSYKYNYVKEKGYRIQALAIGHSQLYDGFKPEFFFLPSFNLCNSAQRYCDDYYLLCKMLPFMPNLRVVIMPIGYMDVNDKKDDNILTDRTCYYHKYMNVDYDGYVPLRYKYEWFDTRRAVEKMVLYYFCHSDIEGCDSLGWRNTHQVWNRKQELGEGKFLERYTRKEINSSKFCLHDESYLIRTIQLLVERNISVFLVSPPYYWDCGFKNINLAQKKYIQDYMEELCKTFPSIHYLNVESDPNYLDEDFFNETHLSDLGAEKFTKQLNDFVKENY